MDTSDLDQFSRQLLQCEMFKTCEAMHRTVASKSYYVCYHLAKSLLENKLNCEVDRAAGGSHKRIQDLLISFNRNDLKAIAYRLNSFHSRRIHADYHLNIPFSRENAESSILDTEWISEKISKL